MVDYVSNETDTKLLNAFIQFNNLHHFNVTRNQEFEKAHQHDEKYSHLKFSEYVLLFHIKQWLKINPLGVSSSEISSHMHVKPPTINPLLTNLEKANLIKRSTDPDDRRIVRITMTPEGINLAQDRQNEFCQKIHGLAIYLGEEKSIVLTELMNDVYSYFTQVKEANTNSD
jgi:DNA-binding MarR family transcriptional regulator